MTGRRQEDAFTLLEVLVAVGVLTVAITLASAVVTGLLLGPGTARTLGVTQATSGWFENATNVWAPRTNFGTVSLLTPVPSVPGATWQAQLCEVDASTRPARVSCGQAVTGGLPRYPGGASTTQADLVRLILTYRPGGGPPATGSLELARR